MEPLPFKTLLYRYFFFGWLFKEVDNVDPFERGLALHHNRRQAAWLPKYMFRWLGWCFFFYGVAGVLELGLELDILPRFLYAASAGCLAFGVMTATAWLTLTQKRQEH
ncbi:hypothetical protein [Ramlibacter sp.]|uniref:hypothetical protein n=1 Tax=Ramlibacter sp. TaxID=1917967 RepID=UPI003D0BF044